MKGLRRNERRKTIKKITVEYDNGEKTKITKGFIAVFSDIDEAEETAKVTFQMCNIEGKDLEMIILSVLSLADKLGMLNE